MSTHDLHAWTIVFGVVVLPFMAIAFYFTPYLVAQTRGHQDQGTILCFNMLLGWTGLVWLICLFWAFTTVERPHSRRRRRTQAAHPPYPRSRRIQAGEPQPW